MSARGKVAALVLTAVAGFAASPGIVAQEAPPPPLPTRAMPVPEVRELALDHGATVVVIPRHEAPYVNVSLVLPGGRAVDPPGRAGLAELTAALLTRGSSERTAREIAEAVNFIGAELTSSAGPDWLGVSVGAVRRQLPAALEILAEVVTRPSFPATEVERLRTRARTALRSELSRPGVLAERALLRAVYGEHPYGRLKTPETLGASSRDDVVAFHDTWFRPERALFVVAGDIEPERARELLESSFAGWSAGPVPEAEYRLPRVRHRTEIVLVHRPGAEGALVRIGRIVGRGAHRDWTALSVATRVLGGGTTGRLLQVLGRERGLVLGADSRLRRRVDRGYLEIRLEPRPGSVGEAVAQALAELSRLGEELVGPEELRGSRDFLVGSFPLRIETPGQLAARVAEQRLLSLPDSALWTYRKRVRGVGPQDVRDAVARHLGVDAAVVVVVGDATLLRDRLRTLGPVRVVDEEGGGVSLADLEPAGRSAPLDGTGLEPVELRYRMVVGGEEVGRMHRVLKEVPERPEAMVFRGEADLAGQSVSQSVTFLRRGFRVFSAGARLDAGEAEAGMDVSVEDGRLVGEVRGPAGPRSVDVKLPEGALVGDMVELAVWLADLGEGFELRAPVVQVERGTVENVRFRVTGVEEVTVPAGTFRAYRVEIGGSRPQIVWARTEAPHVLVKLEPRAQPLALELVEVRSPEP